MQVGRLLSDQPLEEHYNCNEVYKILKKYKKYKNVLDLLRRTIIPANTTRPHDVAVWLYFGNVGK